MASVNRQSLRGEFEALKGRFAELGAEGKITGESRALFEALLMRLQLLMAVFLEKTTPRLDPRQFPQAVLADRKG